MYGYQPTKPCTMINCCNEGTERCDGCEMYSEWERKATMGDMIDAAFYCHSCGVEGYLKSKEEFGAIGFCIKCGKPMYLYKKGEYPIFRETQLSCLNQIVT